MLLAVQSGNLEPLVVSNKLSGFTFRTCVLNCITVCLSENQISMCLIL